MTEVDFLMRLFVAKRALEGEGFHHTARVVSDLLISAQIEADEKRKRGQTSQAA